MAYSKNTQHIQVRSDVAGRLRERQERLERAASSVTGVRASIFLSDVLALALNAWDREDALQEAEVERRR